MATDNQVALSRPPRLSTTSHVPKSTRQVVPAFLQKLYEMVNDPKNSELIRWSDAGDSFFVLDHERFAREVLGRWFKHQNFSSFVRQLNMYGFHKIPHLQQGVLRSEADTEFWNFAHANFHRGQPDLLCLIQRKKQPTQSADDASADFRDLTSAAGASPSNVPQGQVLDIHSIVQGIAAIKRHQTTISAELNELKRSNQLLWQDAMTARARHQKQQDTINRILKFLAGVFGNHAASTHHKDGVVDSPRSDHHAVVPRRRTRLMIEDAKREHLGKVGILEVEDPEADTTEPGSVYNAASYAYPIIETPNSVPSPSPSVAQSEGPTSPSIAETGYLGSTNPSLFAPTSGTDKSRSSITDSSASHDSTFTYSHQDHDAPTATPQKPSAPTQNGALERAVTPSRQPTFEIDPRVQSILNNLSPDQITQLFSSLSQTMADTDYSPDQTDSAQIAFPSNNAFDYAQPPPSAIPLPLLAPSALRPSSPDGIPFDNLPVDPATLSPRLDHQWRAAEDIDKDVNAMHNHINTLIESLGLHPSLLQGDPNNPPPPSSSNEDLKPQLALGNLSQLHDISGIMGADASATEGGINHDFDFDSFLNTISNADTGSGPGTDGIDYNDLAASTAFLDEASSHKEGSVSPVAHIHPISMSPTVSPKAASTGVGKKRKSELSELESALGAANVRDLSAPSKAKRRKD